VICFSVGETLCARLCELRFTPCSSIRVCQECRSARVTLVIEREAVVFHVVKPDFSVVPPFVKTSTAVETPVRLKNTAGHRDHRIEPVFLDKFSANLDVALLVPNSPTLPRASAKPNLFLHLFYLLEMRRACCDRA